MGVSHGLDRWLYRGGRPNRLARLIDRAWAVTYGAGLWPKRLGALELRGRRTGNVISFPVVIVDLEGERYLVAMLGEDANWVRNVRVADGQAALRHGRREPVRLEEVDPAARPPILRRYWRPALGRTSPSTATPPLATSSGSHRRSPCSASRATSRGPSLPDPSLPGTRAEGCPQ
jgi:hypothetical protein